MYLRIVSSSIPMTELKRPKLKENSPTNFFRNASNDCFSRFLDDHFSRYFEIYVK